MALTKETSLRIYNCFQQIDACDKFKKEVTELIDQQKKKADECNEPIPANAYTRYGRGCQMGIPDGGSTTSMTIFGISHELALLVIDEHRKKLVQDLEELQRIAVREQSADFSRNARLFKLLSSSFQSYMKGISPFRTYSEKELIGKLADNIGYTWVWSVNIYERNEAVKDEAIDRIVHTAHQIELSGESLRKSKK